MKILTIAIVAVVCLVLLVDCSTSSARWEGGVVTDKIYEPQTVVFHTDSKGYVTTSTNGPHYYIVVNVGGESGRVTVTAWDYDRWQRDNECMVQFRSGRLMEYGFLSIREP